MTLWRLPEQELRVLEETKGRVHMLTVHWQDIVLTAGTYSGHRVARVTGHPADMVIMNSGTDHDTGCHWARTAPDHYDYPPDAPPDQKNRYVFAFMSVTFRSASGGSPGGTIFNRTAELDLPCPGQWTAEARAWYVWNFGGGPGDNGVYIDAFDVIAGNFIPDDFVDVSPDRTGTLTDAANDGFIDTDLLTETEVITARERLERGFLRFSSWLTVDSLTWPPDEGPTIEDSRITVHKSDRIVAFAFYYEGESRIAVQPITPVLVWALTDAGWQLVPYSPWGPPPVGPDVLRGNLLAAMELVQAAKLVSGEARAELLKAAERLTRTAANAIGAEMSRQK